MKVNQVQINHFKRQIEAALKHAIRKLKDVPGEEFSAEEKVAQIVNGRARFRVEIFAGNRCPYNANDFFKFFEFEGADEQEARNLQKQQKITQLIRRATIEAERLETMFVLEKLEDPVASLDEYIQKYESVVNE